MEEQHRERLMLNTLQQIIDEAKSAAQTSNELCCRLEYQNDRIRALQMLMENTKD